MKNANNVTHVACIHIHSWKMSQITSCYIKHASFAEQFAYSNWE